ncbi:MAG: hypothetical protein LBR60_02165 [Fibrobacter sp.]|nr:hypothetical protein [Fibrobacter sp.]
MNLGIEVGDATLSVALWEPAEKRVVKTAVLDVGASPLDDIPSFEDTLQDWLDENGVDELGYVSVTVSSFRSVVREMFVPPEVTASIRDYVEWNLGLVLNADPSEFFWDYMELAGDDRVGKTIILIAMRRVWVDAIRKGFRKKKIAPQLVETDTISLLNLLETGFPASTEMKCIVKADVSGVMLLWAADERIKALRAAPTFELVGKSREDAYELLATSIAQQIQLAENENGIAHFQIQVCGSLAGDSLFMETLQKTLGELYSVSLLDSFPGISLPEADETNSILSCIGAIGASLHSPEEK